jgi:acylphosphatase
MIKLTATITGIVQGVRYRDFVQVSATELGVTGYVRNNQNGTVTVVAEGWPDVLKEFVEYLNEGSLQAKVDGVAVEWGTATGGFVDFSIQRHYE